MERASIVVMKTGEQIICELKEAFEGEGDERKGVCLVMIHPYILELVQVSNVENPEQDLQVKFSKWIPYAVDTQYKIPYDVVTAIGTPDSGLERAYAAKVEAVTAVPPEQIQQASEEAATINPEVISPDGSSTNIQEQQRAVEEAIGISNKGVV